MCQTPHPTPTIAHPSTLQRRHPPPLDAQDTFPELASALQRLDELRALDPESHPYGAEPTTAQAVTSAKEFLALAEVRYREAGAPPAAIAPYFIGPVPNGGVQLKWRSDHAQLWLIAHPSGGYGYLFENRADPGRFEESDDIALQDAVHLLGNVLTTLPPAASG